MGWSNWNIYQGEITQELMEANMRAMAGKAVVETGWPLSGWVLNMTR